MIEIIYLGLAIAGMLVVNTAYIGWRGSILRKAEAERNNPYGSR